MGKPVVTMTGSGTKVSTVIVGLGLTGLSCARYLASRDEFFAVTDSREEPPMAEALRRELPGISLFSGGFDVDLLSGAKQLIVSPGVSLDEPEIRQALAAGVRVIGDVELFCQINQRPVIAVTGTNGKSTVTSLVGAMLVRAGRKVGVAGNIGVPVLDLVADPEIEIFVLELSSFQLETVVSLDAAAAVVLNLSQDHMDRYTSFQAYVTAKQKIYSGSGVMVINTDDELTRGMRLAGRKSIGFGMGEPEENDLGIREWNGASWLARGHRTLLPVRDLRLFGKHNISNCLAALALGYAAGIPEVAMLDSLREYSGLPHRCQKVAEINGVAWYNDSKGTNSGASSSAITGLGGDRNIILIAGGIGKGADFKQLVPAAAGRVRSAILIGRDARLLAEVLGKVADICYAVDMDAAVKVAAETARAGDIVLLSPACSSFDMFSDYRQRGEVFVEAVRKLQETPAC